ncbi:MAG: DUF4365 domain-containing protein [Eubacteriales bacterium]|nr:DUF4365 domain-containing protein [Eubacteriales bacterium]
MPNLEWSQLNHMQLGQYAEYYAKMEFTSYRYEVYTSEVDDHGVDFVVKDPKTSIFYEVQVKSMCRGNYVFILKDKIIMDDTHLVCFLRFEDDKMPDVYIIPITAWKTPNAVLVDRNYDKPGQKSKPEWGINYSQKNKHLLEPYRIDKFFKKV